MDCFILCSVILYLTYLRLLLSIFSMQHLVYYHLLVTFCNSMSYICRILSKLAVIEVSTIDSFSLVAMHYRKKFKNISSIYPLDVLYATYGHPSDARRSIVVTEQVIRRVCESTFKDRLAFRPHNKLEEILEITYDPCPNENKQLKIRYRVDNVYATLVLDVLPNHRIPSPFLFLTPKLRHLRIFSAFYGHPKGATSTGMTR